jgi:hypothetical protein
MLQRGAGGYLGPVDSLSGLPTALITFTMELGPQMAACPNAVDTFWYFNIENTSARTVNILADQPSIRLVDSTDHMYSGQQQCHLEVRGSFAQPSSLSAGSKGYATVQLDVDGLSSAATYLDLHMQISGEHYLFRTPLP